MATEVLQIGNRSIEYKSYQCPDGNCCEVKMGNSYVDGATSEINEIISAYTDTSLTLQDQINVVEDALVHFESRSAQAHLIAKFWLDKKRLCQSYGAFWSCKNHAQTCYASVGKLQDRWWRSGQVLAKFNEALQNIPQHLALLMSELQRDVNTTALETQVIQLQAKSETAILNTEAGAMKVKQQEFMSNLQKYVIPIALIIVGIMFFRKK